MIGNPTPITMKKTLLMAAAVLAVGTISSSAQSPYSQNIVGVITKPLPGNNAYVHINSPLLVGTNTVEAVMPTIKTGDVVSFWTGISFTTLTYAGANFDGLGHAWVDSQGNGQASPVINPSRGFIYQNNGNAVTNVFCGSVPTTNSTPIPGGHAFTLLVSVIPISGALDSADLALPLQAGDKVFIWSGDRYLAFTYKGANFDGLGHAFTDANDQAQPAPVIQVGQAFFYQNNQDATETWNQSLKI
jgi:hypothetical protein